MAHSKDTPHNISKLQQWAPLFLALAIGLGIVVGMQMGHVRVVKLGNATKTGKIEIGRVEEVLRFIESHYVDSVNGQFLKRAAIQGMLEKLDPHSKYLSPKAMVTVNRDMYNEYVGLGILPRIIGDSVFVSYVFDDSPADLKGVQVGDNIIAVNGQNVDAAHGHFDEEDGDSEVGDTVHLTLRRHSETVHLSIPKAKIPLNEVPAHFMLNDSICYIKIDRFGENVYKLFMQALEELSELGGTQLIIDVRGNAGGFLNEVIKIISQLFAQQDLPIVWAEGVHAPRKVFRTKGRPFFEVKEVVILVDEQTASASEILAGAIQDLSRGVVVGRRTFGKGLVQEQFALPDGYALRITTARYYLPSGRSIQRDYRQGPEAYREKWYRRLSSGELLNRDSIHYPDTVKYYTLKGKPVFDKSGVVPDVFVPYHSYELDEDWSNFNNALDDYIVRNNAAIKHKYQFELVADSNAVVEGSPDILFKVVDTLQLCDDVMDQVLSTNPQWKDFFAHEDSLRKKQDACQYILSSLLYSTGKKNSYYKFEASHDPVVQKGYQILLHAKVDSILNDTLPH